MTFILYRFFYEVLFVLAKIISLFSKRLASFLETRKGNLSILYQKINKNDRTLWFHCASLGEFEQARPLIEHCKKEFPKYKILLTFFSPSGYSVQKNYSLADIVTYLPFDRSRSLTQFIKLAQPKAVFIIKYEFWPVFLKKLIEKKVPIYYVSSIFRPSQYFFKPFSASLRNVLPHVSHFFVQNKTSQELLNTIGITQHSLVGDTRTDRVWSILEHKKEIPFIKNFIGDAVCFIAGSTWEEDYPLFLDSIKKHKEVKTILVPHEIDEKSIAQLTSQLPNSYAKWSAYDELNDAKKDILIIDSIGLLKQLYQYADIVYVGGGAGKRGLHNILEPAVFSVPILIGKNFSRFQEAVDLVAKKGVISIMNAFSFEDVFSQLLVKKEERELLGQKNHIYIQETKGATQKIITKMKNDWQ